MKTGAKSTAESYIYLPNIYMLHKRVVTVNITVAQTND